MLAWALAAMILDQVAPPAPTGPLPSANQLAWYERYYYAFVHFGPNTFTGQEWGHGDEDPKIFNPSKLDCRQWVRAFKDAGMSGVILTTKHHDGFALFPSKFTRHSVEASPWKNGKGDVLRELADACREAGLWLGVYLSPWDRNHPTYGTPDYNQVFVETLKETLTRYGEVKEVWFDGANGEGPNGKRQVYDWPLFVSTVRKYAPNAVIFHDGGDVRWVGNESGYVGDTNWAFLPQGIGPGYGGDKTVLYQGDPNGTYFAPSEVNTSIRPGWFWRASEDPRVKSLTQLKEIFYRSIGHGGNLLLNIPPDDRGLVHDNDIAALKAFRGWREATFAHNLAKGAKASGIHRGGDVRFSPAKAIDGDPKTYWATDDGELSGSIELDLGSAKVFDHVVLGEMISLGQRIKAFEVQADGQKVAKGTTVGFRRIVKFQPVEARRVQIRILDARACPTLRMLEVYAGLPEVEIAAAGSSFLDRTEVSLRTDFPGATIRYTLDGTDPKHGAVYKEPITLTQTCTLRATAEHAGRTSFEPAARAFTRFTSNDLRPGGRAPGTEAGVFYEYIERGWQTLDQMKDAQVTSTGYAQGFDIGQRKRNEHFGFRFSGWVLAPANGVYTFHLASDDGGRLYVGETMIIDNDGLHGMENKTGEAALAAGWHPIKVEYFNAGGGMGLDVKWEGPGLPLGPLKDLRRR